VTLKQNQVEYYVLEISRFKNLPLKPVIKKNGGKSAYFTLM
jgi:hypothetical protein